MSTSAEEGEFLVEPGSVTARLLAGVVNLLGHRGFLTRDSSHGLSEAHKVEVRLIASAVGRKRLETITLAFLRVHGNEGSDEAVAKWKPHVEKVLADS